MKMILLKKYLIFFNIYILTWIFNENQILQHN
jgi:hypothetical protein